MKKVVEIAWKNVWRNPGRSAVIIAAMSIGIATILFVMSFSWGMSQFRVEEAIYREVSHIQIHDSVFLENFDLNHEVTELSEIRNLVQGRKDVLAYTERIKTLGFMESTHAGAGVLIHAIDTALEKKVTQLDTKIIEGSYFGKTRSVPMLIGAKLAKKLRLKLKSKATIRFQYNGVPMAIGVKVKGIFKSANSRIDAMNIYIPKSEMEALTKTNLVTEVAIVMKDDAQLLALQEELNINDINQVDTWRETEPELALAIESFNLAMSILVIIFFLAVALGIVNTMLMAILERVREIGMLMAIGMNKAKVFFMFMLETLFLSLVGAPLGLLIGFIIIQLTGHYGVDLSIFGDGLADLGFASMVYPKLEASKYWLLTGEILLIAIISALIPARRALKLNPATAIRKL